MDCNTYRYVSLYVRGRDGEVGGREQTVLSGPYIAVHRNGSEVKEIGLNSVESEAYGWLEVKDRPHLISGRRAKMYLFRLWVRVWYSRRWHFRFPIPSLALVLLYSCRRYISLLFISCWFSSLCSCLFFLLS